MPTNPWNTRQLLLTLGLPCLGFGSVMLAAWLMTQTDLATSVAGPDATSTAGVLPADFEPHQGLMLAWQQNPDAVEEEAPVRIVEAVWRRIQVVIAVPNSDTERRAETALRRLGLPEGTLRYVDVVTNSPWTRNYGPLIVKKPQGGVQVVDPDFTADVPPRELDDAAPRQYCTAMGFDAVPLPLVLDGGHILSNGSGLCLVSQFTLSVNAQQHRYDETQVTDLLRQGLGAREVVYLEPLGGEPTRHLDVFAAFTAADSVVIGQYSTDVDPKNAELLDRNAERLANVQTSLGPLKVHRIPMPPHDKKSWPTYTNVVFANGVLLVPSYSELDPTGRSQAVALYRKLLPDWQVVEIENTALTRKQGGLRSATLNLLQIEP